jgi:hypothetical protein
MSKWPKQSECLKMFGNPAGPGWGKKNIVRVVPPFPLHMGEIPIPAIKINKIAALSLRKVLQNVWNECGQDLEKLAACHAGNFSGDWVVRQARGLSMISMHAYGLAVDFDAPHTPLGATKTFFTPSNPLVRAFEAEGWIWGGRWTSRRDAMHFQAAIVG